VRQVIISTPRATALSDQHLDAFPEMIDHRDGAEHQKNHRPDSFVNNTPLESPRLMIEHRIRTDLGSS